MKSQSSKRVFLSGVYSYKMEPTRTRKSFGIPAKYLGGSGLGLGENYIGAFIRIKGCLGDSVLVFLGQVYAVRLQSGGT